MSHLDESELRALRDLLERREAQLREEVRTVQDTMIPPAEVPQPDVADTVESAEERVLSALDHVQLRRDQEELAEIAAARERMRDGSYGLCGECAEPIPTARLRAMPTARLCLRHQAERERTHPSTPPFTV